MEQLDHRMAILENGEGDHLGHTYVDHTYLLIYNLDILLPLRNNLLSVPEMSADNDNTLFLTHPY